MAERCCADENTVDINGGTTESDGYPVNMMYGRTPIYRGCTFEEAVKQMAEAYNAVKE